MKKKIGVVLVGPAFGSSLVHRALTEHIIMKHNKVDVVNFNNLKEPEPILITNPNEYLSPLYPTFKNKKSKKKNNRKGHKRKKAKNGR